MPTVTIKNGERTLTLTKRESKLLEAASQLLLEINADLFNGFDDEFWEKTDEARCQLNWLVSRAGEPIKPRPTQLATA